jgi:uncharacterized protein
MTTTISKALAAAFQQRLFNPSYYWRAKHDASKLASICNMTEDAVVRAISERALYRAIPPSTAPAPSPKPPSGSAHYTFNISAATPDRMGDVVVQEGIETQNFRKNPVVLWSHDATQPIGKALGLQIIHSRLQSTMHFNPSSPVARSVESAVRGGFLKAASIGFRPLDWTPKADGSIHFHKVELLEFSLVSIPAQQEALLVNMTGPDGKSFGPKVRAARQREVEIAKLRSVPLTKKEQREVDLAQIRAK